MNSVERWRSLARRRLPRAIFDYLDGGADDELCLGRNRQALDRVTLSPEVLRPVDRCDTRVDFFGESASLPLVIAPTGLNGLFWGHGDLVLARAAQEIGIPFVLSTPATSSLAEVAALGVPDKWFQLYVLEQRQAAEKTLEQAAQLRYRVLLLTVDTPVGGNRTRDLQNGFEFPLRMSHRLLWDALNHPRWLFQLARYGVPRLANLGAANLSQRECERQLAARTMDRSLSWRSLDWLRAYWPGPIVLKGILGVNDAIRARDCGVEGIVVSNHGGRQLDAAPASLDALGAIAHRVGREMTVLVDSGFRSGSDVAKACAHGARGVLVGRAALYGLAAAGLTGVRAVLEEFRDDLQRTLALLGVQSTAELGIRHLISPAHGGAAQHAEVSYPKRVIS